MFDDIREFIGVLGFPMFVAVYFMVASNKSMKELSAVIRKLADKIDRIGDSNG